MIDAAELVAAEGGFTREEVDDVALLRHVAVLRLISELLETLRERGGGVGLFTGCAPGDTGMAVVVRVTD